MEAATFLKALANEQRLSMLCCLIDGALSVGEINARVPLSQSALSQHLAVLREAGLVATTRKSQAVYYSLADTYVVAVVGDPSAAQAFAPDASFDGTGLHILVIPL